MKYAYPELSTVSYNNQRWYLTPSGRYFPSITTVLGHTESAKKVASLANWRNSLGHAEADEITRQAAERGSTVHLLAERFLKGQEVTAPIDGRPVPVGDLESFNALKLKLRKIDEVWGQEVTLYSSVLEVAGRCDFAGVYKGKPVIIDFKTSRRIKHIEDIESYQLQLTFYGTAHNELFGTSIQDGIILMVAETGFPMEFTVKLANHLEELKKRANRFWQVAINNEQIPEL